MHRLPAILIVLLFVPVCLFATEMVPYLGASVAPTFTFSHARISAHPERYQLGEPFTGFGSQFEIGVIRDRFDYYVAYSRVIPYELKGGSQTSYGETTTTFEQNSLQWRDEHWAFGARFRLTGHPETRVQPIVGLAVTSGRITAVEKTLLTIHHTDAGDSVSYFEYNHTDRSASDIGVRSEFGFLVHLPWSFDILAMSRFQYLSTRFHKGIGNSDYLLPQTGDYTLEPSLQIGIRYVIHQIKLK